MSGEVGRWVSDQSSNHKGDDTKWYRHQPYHFEGVTVSPFDPIPCSRNDLSGNSHKVCSDTGRESGDERWNLGNRIIERPHHGGDHSLRNRSSGLVAEDGGENSCADRTPEKPDRADQAKSEAQVSLRDMQPGCNIAVDEDPAERDVGESLKDYAHGNAVRRNGGEERGENRLHGHANHQLPLYMLNSIDQAAKDSTADRATEPGWDVVEASFERITSKDIADLLRDQVRDRNVNQAGHKDDDQERGIFTEHLEKAVGKKWPLRDATEVPQERAAEEDNSEDQGSQHRRAAPWMLDSTPTKAK